MKIYLLWDLKYFILREKETNIFEQNAYGSKFIFGHDFCGLQNIKNPKN